MKTKQTSTESKKVYKIRLKKGDTVIVTTGKFKGQTGAITATHPSTNSVTVEGINVVTRRYRKSEQRPRGEEVQITRPLPVSNVAIIEPTSKKPSKIGFDFDKSGNKIRIYKRTGKEIK